MSSKKFVYLFKMSSEAKKLTKERKLLLKHILKTKLIQYMDKKYLLMYIMSYG